MPPYWYVCNYCNTEYKQISHPKKCKVCGKSDFRLVSQNHRQGKNFEMRKTLNPHV